MAHDHDAQIAVLADSIETIADVAATILDDLGTAISMQHRAELKTALNTAVLNARSVATSE